MALPSSGTFAPPTSPNPTSSAFVLLSLPELFTVLSTPGHPLTRARENSDTLESLQAQAIVNMRNIWANSTWSQRISLQDRLQEFRRAHNLDSDSSDLALDWSIILFVQSTQTIPSSKLTYLKSLAALYRRQDHELPLCSLLSTALGALSTIPIRQALPATEAAVDRMLIRAAADGDPHLQLAIFIMFKTASRVDEVFRLTREQFIINTPEEIIVEWLNKTKTTRLNPWRTSSWVVIHHHAPMTHFNEIINELTSEHELMDWSTSQFTSWMEKDPATATLSGQSLKRGALTILSHMVIGGQLDITIIPRLAKHKVEFDVLPATTLRYLDDRAALARMMKTQEATRLIPCFPRPPQIAFPRASSSRSTSQSSSSSSSSSSNSSTSTVAPLPRPALPPAPVMPAKGSSSIYERVRLRRLQDAAQQ